MSGRRGDGPAPRLYLVAARTVFDGDSAWLDNVRRVAEVLLELELPTAHRHDAGGTSVGGLDLTTAGVSDAAEADREAGLDASIADASSPISVQLRVKELDAGPRRRLLARGLEELAPVRARGITAFVNGSVEEASDLGADGVHWPEAAIPRRSGRPRGLRRGASIHSTDAARRAAAAAADFAVFGPVFAPGSKPGSGRGVDALAEVTSATALPILAIGGIRPGLVTPCLEGGAHGVAVVSAVFGADARPERAIPELLTELDPGSRSGGLR